MRRWLAGWLAVFLAGFALPTLAGDKNQKKKSNSDPADIGARNVAKGKWNFYSPEREIEFGLELAREAEQTSPMLRDPVVNAYVTEVAERVARNSDLRVPLHVRVIESTEVNAFAFPGGYLFITTGMLLETDSEAELAGVIAHEIAHVTARHATRQMTRAHIWNLVSIPLALWGGQVAVALQQGAALMVPMAFLKFNRDAEREADFLGLQYLYASGYDPVAMLDFLERVKAKGQGKEPGIARVFATHPMTKDRVAAAERTIEEHLLPREQYVVTTSRHAEVRTYLVRLLREQAWREGGWQQRPQKRNQSPER